MGDRQVLAEELAPIAITLAFTLSGTAGELAAIQAAILDYWPKPESGPDSLLTDTQWAKRVIELFLTRLIRNRAERLSLAAAVPAVTITPT